MTEKRISMPESLTTENGAKAALIGEFHERLTIECHECLAHPEEMDECETCGGTGDITERIPIEWTTIKEIYKRAVEVVGQSQEDAIAEAVAAERERCAKVCEALIEAIWHEKGSSPEPETGGVSLGETDHEIVVNLEEAAEAIRSAAK